ncbi:two-component system, OmpR family, KDP operon response regulator KdpE [Lachnospiraceae bacterium]|nr:two-component system, OmpR family, KDP operon response regulator KdpE [Lachnospiraceae bacterium]
MNNSECRILIVEDDPPIRKLMTTTLKANGYTFRTASTGNEAELELTSNQPDILLLDLGLPDMDGMEIISTVRSWSQIPIIVVSARSDDSDKIEALDAGADDYLTKPFSVNELLARIRVAQRRLAVMPHSEDTKQVFTNGDLEINYTSGCVLLDGKELQLTPIEYKLLCLLAGNVGKVLTHTYITDHIWGNSLESDVATLRVFMVSLRKKIEKDPSKPAYIQTHVGIGYRMNRL